MSSTNDRTMNGIFPNIVIYFKFIQSYSDSKYDYICFVEGKADEEFYTSLNMTLFLENRIRFLYADYDTNIISNHEVGKEAVIIACEEIFKRNIKAIEKCIFIVDHDYFGLDDCEHAINLEVAKFITVLPVYSFENYFMQEENLKRILYLYLNDIDTNKFLSQYKQFIIYITDFFAHRRTIRASYPKVRILKKSERFYYHNIFCDYTIFFFNFRIDPFFNIRKFEVESKSMNDFIVSHPCLHSFYEQSKEILTTNEDFINGKFLFHFLVYYLKQVHDIDIEIYKGIAYKNIVKKLKVELNIILPSIKFHKRRN